MSDLRIDNFPPDLQRDLKKMAVDQGKPLRQLVIDMLSEGVSAPQPIETSGSQEEPCTL